MRLFANCGEFPHKKLFSLSFHFTRAPQRLFALLFDYLSGRNTIQLDAEWI